MIFSRTLVRTLSKTSMSSYLFYSQNISFRGLLSVVCYFLSGDYRCYLVTLVLVFLLVSFPSPLGPNCITILSVGSSSLMAKPSKLVLVDHLNRRVTNDRDSPCRPKAESSYPRLGTQSSKHDWHILHDTTKNEVPPCRLKSRIPYNK